MKNFSLQKIAFAAFTALAVACFFVSCKKLSNSPVKTLGTQQVIVSTLAGGGVGSPGTTTDPIYGQVGSANGMGTAASFKAPACVVLDAAGNLYVSEAGNSMIRKITPDGMVSTFAGSTTFGFTNGTGAAASFSAMQGIAIDAAGNIYVADSGNQVIRKVTPAGVVTIFAGTGVMGSANGSASSATFNAPTGIAIDAAGNFYVSDFGTKLIRKITADGTVSTLAGSGNVGYDNGAGTTATCLPVRPGWLLTLPEMYLLQILKWCAK